MQPSLPEFDVLVDMARNDPERLEALRQSMVQSVIESSSDENMRRRLAGVQFRVDAVRRRATTPLSACIQISEMMCQSLAELHRSMVAPETHPNVLGAVIGEADTSAPSAKVIPLHLRRRPEEDSVP
ncbi:MAG: DUF3135 domain-containing protein [Pseudomonadaceae bacterium]|nr:DUF3135 domain-containing protein [Pseudomonadaceae bacterium]